MGRSAPRQDWGIDCGRANFVADDQRRIEPDRPEGTLAASLDSSPSWPNVVGERRSRSGPRDACHPGRTSDRAGRGPLLAAGVRCAHRGVVADSDD